MENFNETEIENLKKDFYRFGTLHSWYKHIPIEGESFVFFKSDTQQVRYDFDKCLTNEHNRTYFWHFVVKKYNQTYLNELANKNIVMYEATIGPFFRGLEKGGHFHGFHLIRTKNGEKNMNAVINYIEEKYSTQLNQFFNDNNEIYKHYIVSRERVYMDYNSQLTHLIVNLELEQYLSSVLQFKIYCHIVV